MQVQALRTTNAALNSELSKMQQLVLRANSAAAQGESEAMTQLRAAHTAELFQKDQVGVEGR